eukprot:2235435-Pleurochrysis_carterae.AAC.1
MKLYRARRARVQRARRARAQRARRARVQRQCGFRTDFASDWQAALVTKVEAISPPHGERQPGFCLTRLHSPSPICTHPLPLHLPATDRGSSLSLMIVAQLLLFSPTVYRSLQHTNLPSFLHTELLVFTYVLSISNAARLPPFHTERASTSAPTCPAADQVSDLPTHQTPLARLRPRAPTICVPQMSTREDDLNWLVRNPFWLSMPLEPLFKARVREKGGGAHAHACTAHGSVRTLPRTGSCAHAPHANPHPHAHAHAHAHTHTRAHAHTHTHTHAR